MEHADYSHISPQNLYQIPAGNYILFTLHTKERTADFSPLLQWIDLNHRNVDAIFAKEVGL